MEQCNFSINETEREERFLFVEKKPVRIFHHMEQYIFSETNCVFTQSPSLDLTRSMALDKV